MLTQQGAKNNTWGESYIIKVEHLDRNQMREVQMMLESKGWHTRVEKVV